MNYVNCMIFGEYGSIRTPPAPSGHPPRKRGGRVVWGTAHYEYPIPTLTPRGNLYGQTQPI